MALDRPRALRPGGTLAIVAPAGPIDAALLDSGERRLRAAGFGVRMRDDVAAKRGYLAGDDARRAEELQAAVADPEIDAILCARGGYGCHRIMARLDPELFRAARKPLMGYSDITTLLLWQARHANLAGFHGPMFERGEAQSEEELEAALAWLCGRTPIPHDLAGCPGAGGSAVGPLVGGSLTLAVASLGTPWEIDTRAAILLIEDVSEAPYRIDRMLVQLREAGKLDACAGVGVGRLFECEDGRPGETEPGDVVKELLTGLGIPFVCELPFGHGGPNEAWPVGAEARIDGATGVLSILEHGVEIQS